MQRMRSLSRLIDRLAPQDSLSDTDVERGIRELVRNGVGAQVMDTLAVGAFLTALALDLGANNLYVGVLAAVPHLTYLLQPLAVVLLERVRRRRVIYVVAAAFNRPMLLVMAAAAFIPSPTVALAVLAAGYALRFAIGNFVGCAWNSWVRELVPQARLGEVFGRRLMYMTLFGMVLGLAAGGAVDLWRTFDVAPVRYAYALLFVGAFAGGVYSIVSMARIPEPHMPPADPTLSFRERMRLPFRDENFRRLMLFLGSWNFAVNLAAPFFTVHMLTRIGIDVAWVVALMALSQLANILVMRQWGRIADRFSNKSVLSVCGPLFIACIFAWTFTTFPDRHAFTIPLLVLIHIFTGIATAGVSLASGNIAMKLAPKGEATAYLSTNGIVNSLAAGVAPMLGGLFADFFVNKQLSLVLRWHTPGAEIDFDTLSLEHWDFFFLFAALVGVYSIHRLGHVQEDGEVEERVVLSELFLNARRSIRNLSTVSGLRQTAEAPFDALWPRRRNRSPTDGSSTPEGEGGGGNVPPG
jgi:MFS family permease